jgi:cytochrome bd-type quinol oxidase subunit 2
METPDSPAGRAQQITVLWVLWSAFLVGVCVMYLVLGRPAPEAAPQETLPWLIGVVPVFFSAVVRWVVLPRFRAAQALPWFVIGMAMAEAATLLGIFLFPAHQRELFTLSLLGIAQFAPTWARRAFATEEETDRLRS